MLEFNKRFSNNVQMQSSYTWQDSKAFGSGAVTGSTQQDFSNLSPTAGYGRDPNDTINAFGPTATNAPHAVKIVGDLRRPLGNPAGRALLV